mmetsp:Transcript_6009/g.6206  ORF Transcript_6009/g.6206 Transcript_6009/m.6206 type:complete len:151 (-) Transcript_6009:70-522(-)|eukprot:CAMPEP_0182416764 /NCGR_PEP_ID=MMETSP1167-20130531/1122_1 /TAXON_ID=2988 /ORGANISM="Mallomonas Sp, Strain CCMP3275" /LENGTH=150 /DNA_ID=CAMNT_0024589817 /DNA_START=175 /DNA_END=627 /DNA_ORIENTATION=-
MGRYTTVQTYSDQNTKVVSGYATGEGPTNGPAMKPKALMVEKVDNVSGSCAGAGSGEFDLYRAARRRELNRLDEIERKKKAFEEQTQYEEKVARNRKEAEERTAKNAEKRKRKQEKKRLLAAKFKESKEESNESDEEENKHKMMRSNEDI